MDQEPEVIMNYYSDIIWAWQHLQGESTGWLQCLRNYTGTSAFTDVSSWWRHQMETFSALLALCAGNSTVLVNSPHKGQWRRALMFSLRCAWINDWVNNREAGDLRCHRGHYDVIVMYSMAMLRQTFLYKNVLNTSQNAVIGRCWWI